MHRIDGPGATVDNKFTEGDPTGGVQATVVTAPWLNDMQEEMVSVLSAAAITPVKGTQNQILQAIRKIGTGLAGAVRNGRMIVTAASATATYNADEVVVKSGLGGTAWLLPSFTKSINLAGVGAGGMDIGLAPVSGFVAIYAAYNPNAAPSSTNPMLIAKDTSGLLAPEIYGGANMPAGYTASGLVGIYPTTAARLFKPGSITDRLVQFDVVLTLGTTTASASFVPFNVTGVVPLNAKTVNGNIGAIPSVTTQVVMDVAGSAAGTGGEYLGAYTPGGSQAQISFVDVPSITPNQLFYKGGATSGTVLLNADITGYKF
ncbi:hypothetical protein [Pseudomonas abietaniphila]|uniref:Uncharacterized protein n=1 Tax=Pseudomonas abietaniphila TaxID=89065 RepID=A0A1G8LH60_9PSED|nr:hypothetical protein [Pseudomonas abietaniphila]SDI54983.1 hypothetical protein SAMN05216605_114143 [Pseudomonas abietaniphila]